MTALPQTASEYAQRGFPVFPCNPERGPKHKSPLTSHGFKDATTDPARIGEWWRRRPDALIGVPTGSPIAAVVLDIDVKRPEANGFDTLDDLGFSIFPETPMVHTSSGGMHLYFAVSEAGLRNTAGARGRGIGPGLDWRGDGGYVILPSDGSGYFWDPHHNVDTVQPVQAPAALLPREIERAAPAKPVKAVEGLSPYAKAALDKACRAIVAAPHGEQETTLNGECFSIGTLAGAKAIPDGFALRILIWAAQQIRSHDPRPPWRPREIEEKVKRAFAAGLLQPRSGDAA